jgi:hypothetical protein
MPDWDANNSETTMVDIPVAGSFHVQPCNRQQIGPRRDCGFSVQASAQSCTPGATVTLDCAIANPDAPMIVRVCEDSHALDTTITCSYFGSHATEVVTGASQFTFTCPEARDATEVGGRYSLLTAPLVSDGTNQPVSCSVL